MCFKLQKGAFEFGRVFFALLFCKRNKNFFRSLLKRLTSEKKYDIIFTVFEKRLRLNNV